jgi:hypothetical protein
MEAKPQLPVETVIQQLSIAAVDSRLAYVLLVSCGQSSARISATLTRRDIAFSPDLHLCRACLRAAARTDVPLSKRGERVAKPYFGEQVPCLCCTDLALPLEEF